jgi:hypothetical protein
LADNHSFGADYLPDGRRPNSNMWTAREALAGLSADPDRKIPRREANGIGRDPKN